MSWGYLTFLLGSVALQACAGYAVLTSPRAPPAVRGSMSLLFLLNATIAGLDGLTSIRVVEAETLKMNLDAATNGLLVLSASTYAAALTSGRIGALPWLLAVTTTALPLWHQGETGTAPYTYTIAAYAYAGLQFVRGQFRSSDRSRAEATWALAAFAPRIVEFAIHYCAITFQHFQNRFRAPEDLIFGLAFVLVAFILVCAAGAAVAAWRARDRPEGRWLAILLGVGLLLGMARIAAATLEGLLTWFSLIYLRPAVLLVGMISAGFVGERADKTRMGRVLVAGTFAAGAFLLALRGVPSVLNNPTPARTLPLAGAGALLALPVGAAIARRMVGRGGRARAANEGGDSGGPRGQGVPASAPDHPPGLDPRYRFDAEDLAFYWRAKASVRALPPARRSAIGALTRKERLLLALRGSSLAPGAPEFTYKGVHLATHIPHKYLGEVVEEALDHYGILGGHGGNRVQVLVVNKGRQGVTSYTLTKEGERAADALARQIGLPPDPREGRLLLGQFFYSQNDRQKPL